MPILAVPYLMPYAQLAGLAIGSVATALGLKALSDKVQAHMEDNPEESLKILTMIMPAEGLMALFNKEAGDEGEGEGEGEEIIDLDEDKPKSKKSKKQIILEELGKEKGSYASPEAEGSWASKRGRIIRRLKEEGKITDKPDPDYDPNKPKFNWKRFTRNKADGGRVGFVAGGALDRSTLNEQAQSIYDSMKSADHLDQTIIDHLQSLGLYDVGGAAEGIETITNIQPAIGGGGGGGSGGLDLTYTEGAVPRGPTTDFNINPAAQLTGKGRIDPMGGTYDNLAMMGPMDYKTAGYHMSEIPGQEGYEAPSKYFEEPSLIDKGIGSVKNFFSGLGTPRERGTLGTRLSNQPRLPLPASMASWSMSPFNEKSRNYNENFVDQLNFLEGQEGLIGRDQGSGLLRYGPDSVLSGKNVISGFGSNDYEVALNKYLTRMRTYTDPTKHQLAKIAKAKAELEAWQNQNKGDAANQQQTLQAQITAQANKAAQQAIAGGAAPDYGKTETRQSSGWDYSTFKDGGLATMFERRR